MAMLPSYKDIVDLIKKGSTLEAQEKIVELREAAIELQEEVLKLREQVQALEKRLATTSKLEFERPYYWLVEGDRRDGPFCQLCQDKAGQLIRLQDGKDGIWRCKSCGHAFFDKSYREPNLNPRGGSWMSS